MQFRVPRWHCVYGFWHRALFARNRMELAIHPYEVACGRQPYGKTVLKRKENHQILIIDTIFCRNKIISDNQ